MAPITEFFDGRGGRNQYQRGKRSLLGRFLAWEEKETSYENHCDLDVLDNYCRVENLAFQLFENSIKRREFNWTCDTKHQHLTTKNTPSHRRISSLTTESFRAKFGTLRALIDSIAHEINFSDIRLVRLNHRFFRPEVPSSESKHGTTEVLSIDKKRRLWTAPMVPVW